MGLKTTFSNFRDFGGLEIPGGRKFKDGMIYRCSRLAPKNAEEKEILQGLKLDCVLDFRTPAEVKEKPDKLPKGVEYVNVSVFGDTKFQILAPTRKSKLALLGCTDLQFDEIMQGIRDSYAYMPYARHAYKELFARLNAGRKLAFHCTAGKDRTGVAAMIIELALGRTREQAHEQYMLSNQKRAGKNGKLMKMLKLLPLSDKFYECVNYSTRTHDELFDIAYDAIFSKYPTIDEFLLKEYGVTSENIKAWRDTYTEEVKAK